MLIEAARRAETAVKEMLALVNEGSVSCAETRQALAVSKAISTVNSAFQTSAAKVIAAVERHGDGGAQVLADAAGLSRRDARGQVKTARVIEAAPSVRDAVESGRVSLANAERLAEAVTKTSAGAVDSDADLLSKAETMRPEDFTREARRWATARQVDSGESEYQRQRARRCVRVWDADDGMVELHGKFDPVTGRRIGNRLQAEARRLYEVDKKNAKDAGGRGHSRSNRDAGTGADTGNGSGLDGNKPTARRSFDQCMADALDAITSTANSGGVNPFADITVVAHIDNDTGRLVAEIAGGDPLPPTVLEEINCNARLKGAIYDTKGALLWQGYSRRFVTQTQMDALIARYGGCFHCKAHPDMCQAHHIEPVSQGGPTNIDNMVPICWDCHQKVHHYGWQIHTRDGQHTLHPPNRVHYGPALAPEQSALHVSAFDVDAHPAKAGGHPPEQVILNASGAEAGPGRSLRPGSQTGNGHAHSAQRVADPADPHGPLPRPGPATARAALMNAHPHRDRSRHAGNRRRGPAPPPPTEPKPPDGQDEPLFRLN